MQQEYMFGRIEDKDSRDYSFNLVLGVEWPKRIMRKNWTPGPVLDQDGLNACVGFAWQQFLNTTPLKTYGPDGRSLWEEAKRLDPWPENDLQNSGTTLRAGVQALQRRGHIKSYLFSWNVEEVARWILTRGPVVLGCQWYQSMMTPSVDGFVRPGGQILGGHAILVYGTDRVYQTFNVINSWSVRWGLQGRFKVTWDVMNMLLDDGGECCTAVEQRLVL